MARACDRCGRLLGESVLRYIVEIAVTADVPPDLDPALFDMDLDEEFERILAQFDAVSSDELEAQVYQKMVYLLCPECRQAFVKNPLGHTRGSSSYLQ